MKDKLILVDVDGVLLDWETGFGAWMEQHGYKITHTNYKSTYNLGDRYGISHDEKMYMVRGFNTSEHMGWLEPHRDAVEIVRTLNEDHGYRFEVITSMSDDPTSRKLRIKNLKDVFGDVFADFVFLDTGADKHEALKPYTGSGYFWIEDKEENAQAGLEVGLNSLIMEHGFNMYSTVAPKIKNWKEFYDKYIC